MSDYLSYACIGLGVVIAVVVLFLVGILSGELIVKVCDWIGWYQIDAVQFRGVWLCVYLGVAGVCGSIKKLNDY